MVVRFNSGNVLRMIAQRVRLKARTVALPSLAVEELRRWRLAQAEELLKLGIRTGDSWHVITAADGSTPQPPGDVQVPEGMGPYPARAPSLCSLPDYVACFQFWPSFLGKLLQSVAT